ncbi:hypothetical protein [Microbispora hainanensis]|uniref:Uncharacterized protein n=1 Tax=Microbispora hainanensis TaxID=568844 RepID=A0A544YZX9_9ACTN|nr:hypothetical protein [Microbispora hainanensis]TQS22339.1 hypothetical protein FLX08_08075 [Microbispora hainanensis]
MTGPARRAPRGGPSAAARREGSGVRRLARIAGLLAFDVRAAARIMAAEAGRTGAAVAARRRRDVTTAGLRGGGQPMRRGSVRGPRT